MEATPSTPQHGRHRPCLHLQKPRLLHKKLAYIQVHARIPHRFPTLPTPARPSERRNRRGADAESKIALLSLCCTGQLLPQWAAPETSGPPAQSSQMGLAGRLPSSRPLAPPGPAAMQLLLGR
jgi:hypothetical protein